MLPAISGCVFWFIEVNLPHGTTNQKHYPDLGGDASSVWNFCSRFSDFIREFKKRRFWATHVTRKWSIFPFNMPWRYQICILKKCLSSSQRRFASKFDQNHDPRLQKGHFLLTFVAQKRRCFSSLFRKKTSGGFAKCRRLSQTIVLTAHN